jgi:hypothetical protein
MSQPLARLVHERTDPALRYIWGTKRRLLDFGHQAWGRSSGRILITGRAQPTGCSSPCNWLGAPVVVCLADERNARGRMLAVRQDRPTTGGHGSGKLAQTLAALIDEESAKVNAACRSVTGKTTPTGPRPVPAGRGRWVELSAYLRTGRGRGPWRQQRAERRRAELPEARANISSLFPKTPGVNKTSHHPPSLLLVAETV